MTGLTAPCLRGGRASRREPLVRAGELAAPDRDGFCLDAFSPLGAGREGALYLDALTSATTGLRSPFQQTEAETGRHAPALA